MFSFSITSLKIVLPLLILFFGYVIKLCVGREVREPDIISSLLELPIAGILLAMSFMTSYTVSNVDNIPNGLVLLFIYFIVAILVVHFCRVSNKHFLLENYKVMAIWTSLNYLVCAPCLYVAISIL